jgi:predicted nucleotidyltransferase
MPVVFNFWSADMYSVNRISNLVAPVATKYDLAAVYLFGSHARGTARAGSDVDLLVDTSGSSAKGFAYGALFNDLERVFGKDRVDVIESDLLNDERFSSLRPGLVKRITGECVKVYERK